MAIIYKIDILAELKKAGFTTYQIRREKLLSESAMQNLRQGKEISFSSLDAICAMLDLQPGDIIGHTHDKKLDAE